ncbi:AIF_HP2_G0013860.mRNA.1.CDS.1 [Saccharomyces cerevisiae]|nr:AIF_HP2_G0013860.mRNA.1.CDS.1 [Saccharomyces cerevisiae]CAI6461732.1 AIF_HP2_G0013860.mRNA.1.CDS.1 [Saccharomyces cerevisiae]
MSSAQSSIDSDGDIRDADIHVAPPVEKEWSDGFDDNEVINGDNVEPPKRGLIGYLVIYLLCYPISFGGFLPGWDSGITAGFINMDNFKMNFGSYKHSTGEYYLSNVRMGLLVAMFSIGCAIGGLIFARLADTLGRRLAIVIVVLVYMVGAIIQISSNHKWYQYFVGKIIYGLGAGGCSVLCPMLLSEIAPTDLRGGLVSLYQLNMTFGIFLGYCSVYGTRKYDNTAQWRVPLGLCFLWTLIIIIGMLLVPESPRYLIECERHEEARASIAKINKVSPEDPWVLKQADEINAGVLAQRELGEASWKELFSVKTKVLQRLITGILVQTFLQLTGENYFFFYGTTIFKSVGLTDGFETSIVLGTVNFFSTIIAVMVVDKIGRRKCLLFGAAGMMACMVIFASIGVKCLYPHGQDGPSSKGAGNAMIVFTCFYIFCFATTWAPVAYIVVAESFPSKVKSRAMSISTACNWLWQFLIGFFTPFITGSIHFYYGYVFVGCLVAMFLYVFFFLPETIGLSLEEIQLLYEEGIKPWKSASWVPPSRRGISSEESKTEKKDWKKFLKFSKGSD